MIQHQKFSDTVHKGGSNLSPTMALVSGNALLQPPCELISRYWQIVKSPNHSPYYLSKKEETASILIKIEFLKNVLKCKK